MTLNHPFYLVICCSSSERHFRAVTVKFLLNFILSLFFLLIIRASIWSPYGKNLAEPCYYQKDDQFAKYCHTPLNARFHLVFRCLSSNRHFWTVTLKFLLNPVTKETMTNLQNTVKRLGIIVFRKCFAADHQSDVLELLLHASESSFWPRCLVPCIRTTFCRSFVKILAEPNCGSKDGQFIKHWHTPVNQRFQLDLWRLPSERHFEALTVKIFT